MLSANMCVIAMELVVLQLEMRLAVKLSFFECLGTLHSRLMVQSIFRTKPNIQKRLITDRLKSNSSAAWQHDPLHDIQLM